MIKKLLLGCMLMLGARTGIAQHTSPSGVPQQAMQEIYEQVKTPYKYGVVVPQPESGKMVDSPTVFRKNGVWYMTYIVFDGKGYETWLSQSDNLLEWTSLGKIMSFTSKTWDATQKAGYAALVDTEWGGSYAQEKYQGKYWLSYLGGSEAGYEAGRLGVGIANTADLTKPREVSRLAAPVLAANDKDARWYDDNTIYKSLIIRDKSRKTGFPFVMYYNAKDQKTDEKGQGFESIAMAVSNDMVHWRRLGEKPLLSRHTGICGDAQITKIGNLYVMFYFGAFWKPGAFERFACSYDLVNWTDWEGPDLISPTEAYDKTYAHKPWVVKWNGVVYHFYNAVGDQGRVIALTTSKDLRKTQPQADYTPAKAPLRSNPYSELPLGAIKPQGWLKEMLVRQQTGSTGKLDELYPLVMGKRNGWLGGDGDQWERGPYWIDGLLPLAYILDDQDLIAKTRPWVEWAIASQQPDGYFGPAKDYAHEPGIQRDNSRDWWPKMVMLKILKQYYSATRDPRVITLMTNYFKYQLKELPAKPLDHWTFWARYRGADNLMVVYWLYNITGDRFLLDLGNLIHGQTFDYTHAFLDTDLLSTRGSIHCVNLAQGMKAPMIYFQHHPDSKYLDATRKGFADIRKFNGMAHGMYGGDEALHGNDPTQGSELCSAVEMMFSLESILEITGDVAYADMLEKVAFNALPTQASDDFMTRQYFQQANQVMMTRHHRNFDVNHGGTDVCMGLLTGYPCCTSNMHQGWPKYVQNLWYATADNGIAALTYSASEATIQLAGGIRVAVKEETSYPFEETVKFTVNPSAETIFPFHLRIPAWCKKGLIKVNGKRWLEPDGNQVVKLTREWKKGDIVELVLPMHIFKNKWVENSVSVERGPLTYALKIGETSQLVQNDKDPVDYGKSYTEVRPTTPWNYGLILAPDNKLEEQYQWEAVKPVSKYPWNPDNAPLQIKTKARRIPSWGLYNEMAGPVPYSMTYQLETDDQEEEIVLIPYGCTNLRISQFPQIHPK